MRQKLCWMLLLTLTAAGCASWKTPDLDLSRYRDPRATDLDSRLSNHREPFGSPFSSRAEDE